MEADSLTNWADLFREDLRGFADRVGRWRSFDEFSSFISHAERLLWTFGVFPWRDPEAGDRIDIPLLTDAEWLTHAPPP